MKALKWRVTDVGATQRIVIAAATLLASALLVGCNGDESQATDPHVVPNRHDFDENRALISPPNLGYPIYECAPNVTITDFLKDALLEVFIDGAPAPNPPVVGGNPDLGVNFDVGLSFTAGQSVFVRQTKDGVVSDPSNTVVVTSHTEEYPAGLPTPRLFKHPLRECGHAVLVEDVVPGSRVEVFSEDALGGGAFGTPVHVGGFNASTEWGHNWTGVDPQFTLGARVTARARLCTDVGGPSPPEITELAPAPMPAGSVEPPVIEGQELVTVWGAAGPSDPPEHGAILTIYDSGSVPVSKTPAPGGAPHLMGIPAAPLAESYEVTQTLCVEGPTGGSTPVLPCEDLPPAKIQPPLPGDVKVYVTEHQPGAEILVFASGQEVGHSSGTELNLVRPLAAGETVVVLQRLGDCESSWVYQIDVECYLGDDPNACSGDWPSFRHSAPRTARQVNASLMSDPYAVKRLEVKWQEVAPDGGAFNASPVVRGGRVFIGSSAGHLYAYDANAGGKPLWEFPAPTETALTSRWPEAPLERCANPSSHGIAASVAMATIESRDVVILAAPDQGRPSDPGGTFGAGLGSGRLFALDAQSGALIWKSGEIARLSGLGPGDPHEQIGYSSPLVLDGRIYVGIANHCDNPIQRGKVIAVELNTGNIVGSFNFEASSTSGGGVWTYVSGGLGRGLFTTTGNTRSGNPGGEPANNHGLSMVRIDPATGSLQGKIQPVPFVRDDDPDWSAGATLIAASCGDLSVSTMKDGWSYAGNVGAPLGFRWQFPDTAYPFPANDPNDHGDIRYHRAGAAWNDVYTTMTGGEDIVDRDTPGDTFAGYNKLHALNVCAERSGRVRWIADVAAFTRPVYTRHDWGLGPPTVTHGLYFVGTNEGWLLAIADPSVWPAQGSRCTWSQLSVTDCVGAGFQIVPIPTILKSIRLEPDGHITRTEPVIANDSLYVATSTGRLFRLAPGI